MFTAHKKNTKQCNNCFLMFKKITRFRGKLACGDRQGVCCVFVLAGDRRMTSVSLEAVFCEPRHVLQQESRFTMKGFGIGDVALQPYNILALVRLARWKLETDAPFIRTRANF